MEYIKKLNTPPDDWDAWFTKATGIRSFNYGPDYDALTNISSARNFLINEQNYLCAYCQQEIKFENSSIEHVIPKEFNVELSTSYFNLVAVCKTQIRDPYTKKFHCDKEKGSKFIAPIIFLSNSFVNETSVNFYFKAFSDGTICAKHTLPDELKQQVESFIEILNLNHHNLKEKRAKDVLDGYISVSRRVDKKLRFRFWQNQYKRVILNKKQPFRQFLLVYIGEKIGVC